MQGNVSGQDMSGFDLNAFLPYQLAVLASRVSREFSTLYKQKFGISVAEWRVVAHLSQEGSVSVREIHRRVDMDKSKVSRAASRLESRGFVTKSANPEDGRLVSLALTGAGREMIAEMTPIAREFEASVLAELGEDAEAFRGLIAQLVAGVPKG